MLTKLNSLEDGNVWQNRVVVASGDEVQKGIKGRCETCAPVFKVHASFSELRLVGWD